MVSPAYVRTRFGDGKRLLGLMPMMYRPRYYLVWVDSKLSLEGDEWLDTLDSIWEAIGEEFGSRPHDDTGPYRWPEEDSSGGCCWFEADASDVLPRRRLAAVRRNHGNR